MSIRTKMTELADAVRDLTGETELMTLDAMILRIREAGSSVLINSAEGDFLLITDCLTRKLHGLTLFGRTTQASVPSPSSPAALRSVGDTGTVSINSDGQVLTVSTPGGLPGIPVVSGGNYTDAAGQQWLCNEISFSSGKRIQRIGVKVLNGTEEMGAPAILGNVIRWQHSIDQAASAYAFGNSLGFFSHASFVHKFSDDSAHAYVSGSAAVFFLPVELVGTTPSEIRAYAAAQYAAGTPLTVMYPLAAPVEAALTAEELADYSAMHTNYPQTVISNDSNAWMSVQYAADTKTYIDSKFADAASAIVNNV